MEGVSDPAPTRQLAPGLLLMPESGRGEGRSRDPVLSRCLGYRYNAATEQAVQLQLRTTSIIAQELLDSGQCGRGQRGEGRRLRNGRATSK